MLGAGVPVYVIDGGAVTRFGDEGDPSPIPAVFYATSSEELDAAEESVAETEGDGSNCAIALPPGAPLWAQALIGLRMSEDTLATQDISGL